MKALHKINPSLHNNLSCMKRVGVFTWILGWGVYSNARNIAKIKDNNYKTSCKTNKLNNWLTYDTYGWYHSPTKILTPSEEEFLYIPFKNKTSCKTNKLNNWLTS